MAVAAIASSTRYTIGERMSLPRLLLLVNGHAAESGIGNIFLSDLCASYPPGKLCRFSTVRQTPNREAHSWCGRPVEYFKVLVSTVPILSSFTDWNFQHNQEAELVSQAAHFGRENSVDAVWAVFNSTYIIRTALAVANKLDVPLYTTVWDPPEVFRINMHLNQGRYDDIYMIFLRTLGLSTSVSVIGESMAAKYDQELGIRTIPLAHGYRAAEWTPDKVPFKDDKVRIGFAGSLYAKREWRAFLRALESVEWNIAGRPVELHQIGRRPLRGAPMPEHVIRHGCLSNEDTLDRLRDIDIGYLPYWFDGRYKAVASLAFPSKASVYLAAGCRIFYHGPDYGSPTAFLTKYNVGTACHDLRPAKIVEALDVLIRGGKRDLDYSKESKRVCSDLLSYEAMLRQFTTFLGGQRDDLIVK
jgi:hypothetical protein